MHPVNLIAAVIGVCLFVAPWAAVAEQSQKEAPIMAIVVEPYAYDPPVCVSVWGHRVPISLRRDDGTMASGCVWSVYVDWLEASGIRVLPLPWNAPPQVVDDILDRVNGVLFPGGIIQGDMNVTAAYFSTVQYIFDRAVHQYFLRDEDGFVVWGTCQGFELLNAAAAGTLNVISSGFIGTDPSMLPLSFVPSIQGPDRLFAGMTPSLKNAIQTNNVSLNWHSKGVEPNAFHQTNTTLGAWLQPLTVNVDTTGRPFVSSVQGINQTVRLFGTQFHPERPPFEFDNDIIAHDTTTIELSAFLALQLRQLLSQSNHSFENASRANALLIETYPRINHGWGVQVYVV